MTGRIIKKRPFYGSLTQEEAPWEAPHREIAREAAAQGMVLQKNEDHLLPLASGERIALFGPGAIYTLKGGTGSGDVNERDSVSIYQGLKNGGFVITNEDWIRECDRVYQEARIAWRDTIFQKRDSEEGKGKRFFMIYSTTPFVIPEGPPAVRTDADTAIYVISRVAGEGAGGEVERQLAVEVVGHRGRVAGDMRKMERVGRRARTEARAHARDELRRVRHGT